MSRVSCGTRLNPGCSTTSIDTPCTTVVPPTACGPDSGAMPCAENHCLEIQTSLYGAALITGAPFVTPGCGQSATVFIPGLTIAHVGSYLWSSIYGYYEITNYNVASQEVTLKNNCTSGNVAGGVTVPTCSTFVVTSPPILDASSIVYLTADFVTPAIGFCVTIAVTDTSSFSPGLVITIGTGQYTINSVNTPTSMTICNTGSGQTPGTTITALNPSGGYNYPIILQDVSSVLENTATQTIITFNAANPNITLSTTVVYTNPSLVRPAQLFFFIDGYYNGDSTVVLGIASYTMSLLKDTTGVDILVNAQDDSTTADTVISKQMTYAGIEIVSPGTTVNIEATVELDWVADATAQINISELVIHLSVIAAY